MIRLLYNVLLVLLSPLWVPWMLRRSSRRAEKVNWRERFGYLPILTGPSKRVWVHAVSVGEVVACLPILAELRTHDLEIILFSIQPSERRTEEQSNLFKRLLDDGQLAAMAFEVDDCRATYEELKAKGVQFRSEPEEQFYGIECTMMDDSGNWFSVTQQKPH